MKSYLSLIPISAKVRRRQNRLTILCIVTAMFLVTAIFSVADMMLRTQTSRAVGKSGSWHLEVTGITPEQAAQLAGQPDVVRVGAGAVFNENGESAYRLNGKRVVLYGADADYVSLNRAAAFAGTYPQAENEVLLGKTAARVLHVGSGDTVTLTLPDGTEKLLTVTGIGGIDEDFYGEQYSIVDVYLPQEAFAALLTANGEALPQTHYELEYTSAARAAKALPELRSRYGETAVQENLQVMGSAGQSSSTAFRTVYGMAAVLFVLVLLAGVLMISGSMTSNLAQRTQFFGMMRCIGMSKRQVIRFVRLEALNWCRTAVPIGLVLGTLASWTSCAALRYGIGGEFAAMRRCCPAVRSHARCGHGGRPAAPDDHGGGRHLCGVRPCGGRCGRACAAPGVVHPAGHPLFRCCVAGALRAAGSALSVRGRCSGACGTRPGEAIAGNARHSSHQRTVIKK